MDFEDGGVTNDQEGIAKMREEFDELWVPYEYTEWKHTQLEEEVKEIRKARYQGLAEILNLQKTLDEAKDEITVLKKVMRHNSGGGVSHVKVKEPESYDGTRSAKTLGNFLWDMEQYLEHLGLPDEETKVKVAAQFLMKDAKMWW